LPRTSHWTATALEDAGWEIRDIVTHLFGSGFPKSLDIGKKIDEMAGFKREILGPRLYGENQRGRNNVSDMGFSGGSSKQKPVTIPMTKKGEKYDGFGSGLKPASEHWILCRKPVEGTIAANVLTHGVGGINIDACRVEYASDYDKQHQGDIARGQENATNGRMFGLTATESKASSLVMKGRWPANLVLSHSVDCGERECVDGCAILILDKQGGIRKSGTRNGVRNAMISFDGTFGEKTRDTKKISFGSEGTASRYFPNFHYYPKASQRDRTCNKTVENNHPTVKNRDLMRWLVNLITPPGGLVLDMFGGSGSTAIACIEEGFNYLLFEQETEFVAIAKARINATKDSCKPTLEELASSLETENASSYNSIKTAKPQQLSLFR
jgi:DNA methylase